MKILKLGMCLAVFISSVVSVRAVQLGQTMEELVAESGQATSEDHARQTAQYRWHLWKIDVQFKNEKISALTYTKTDSLIETEIQKILNARSNGRKWSTVGSAGMTIRNWMRSDYAMAIYDPKFPRTLLLKGGKYEPPRPAQVLVSPLEQPVPAVAKPTQPPVSSISVATPALAPALQINTATIFYLGAIGLIVCVIKACSSRISRKTGLHSSITPPPVPWQPPGADSPTLHSITWEQFEMLVGEVFRRKGWEVELSAGLGPDGGVDLRLSKSGESALVQCKHWKSQQVGVKDIREFFGTLVSQKAARGIFVASGTFSKDATEFAEGKPIELIGQIQLKQLVAEVSQPGENIYNVRAWKKQFQLLANLSTPNCPRCDKTMVSQTARRNGNRFWGCPSYPACNGQRKLRAELQEA